MKLVYVAGPFRASTPWGIEQNIRRAETLALAVWQAGFACICPHANTRFFQHELKDEAFLQGDLVMVERCDAVLLTKDWIVSIGARGERAHAMAKGIPVFESLGELKEWGRSGAT